MNDTGAGPPPGGIALTVAESLPPPRRELAAKGRTIDEGSTPMRFKKNSISSLYVSYSNTMFTRLKRSLYLTNE